MKKRNANKGFSLVELIVVIAIMAVLIGLLAPQFVKYVGESQDSRDKANLEAVRRAANVIVADVKVVKVAGQTFTVNKDGVAGSNTAFAAALQKALGSDALSAITKSYTVTIQDAYAEPADPADPADPTGSALEAVVTETVVTDTEE